MINFNRSKFSVVCVNKYYNAGLRQSVLRQLEDLQYDVLEDGNAKIVEKWQCK